MKKTNNALKRKRTGAGSYSAIATIIVIALAVCANALAGSLPASVTQLDLTSQSLFSLSDQTIRIVKSVDQDVTMYLLASSGYEDQTIMRLLERYRDLNSHVKIETVDPALKPTFLNGYDLSVSNLYENSVIVDSNGRYRLVGYDEIYITDYEMDYYSYSYTTTNSFDGENALTNALHYVTNDSLPKVYMLTGHGESKLGENITSLLSQDNMEYDSLSLLTLDAVPEDASVIVISAPSTDLSEEEADLLINWLDNGGRIVLFTYYIDEGGMQNLLTVTSHMGVTAKTGLIVEGDAGMHLSRYPYYLLPEIESHEITDAVKDAGYYILMAMSQPIVEAENSDATVSFFLNTSDEAYLKAKGMNTETIDKENGDETGTFSVGAACEKGEGRLVWFATETMLDSSIDRMVSGANSNTFMNAVNWMCDQIESISIRAKSLDVEGLTVTGEERNHLSILMIGVLPMCIVGLGTAVTIRRKRK